MYFNIGICENLEAKSSLIFFYLCFLIQLLCWHSNTENLLTSDLTLVQKFTNAVEKIPIIYLIAI